MRKKKINRVIDNIDKHKTYTNLNQNRYEAINKEKYLEIIIYSYAMLEDRLLSFLHYLYVIDRNLEKPIIELYSLDSIKTLMVSKDKGKKYEPHLNNISTKINIIKKICKYKGNDELILKMKNHLNERIGVDIIIKNIKNLKEWLNFRNEIIHGLYNKNYDDFEKKLCEIAMESIKLSVVFDSYSDELKGNINKKGSLRSELEKVRS